MPAALDAAVDAKSTSSPWKRKTPPSRRCTPATILTSVDLPAPFSPTRAWMVPGCATGEPDRSAATAPKDVGTARRTRVARASFVIDVLPTPDRRDSDELPQGSSRTKLW